MKKVFYPLACCCLAAGVFASCGGQKKSNAPGRTGQGGFFLP